MDKLVEWIADKLKTAPEGLLVFALLFLLMLLLAVFLQGA